MKSPRRRAFQVFLLTVTLGLLCAAIVANKVRGVRACLIHEAFSAHQGVEVTI